MFFPPPGSKPPEGEPEPVPPFSGGPAGGSPNGRGRSCLGVAVIALGVLAGVSAASKNLSAEAERLSPAERLGQAIGGSLCSLTLVVGGFLMARSGGRSSR